MHGPHDDELGASTDSQFGWALLHSLRTVPCLSNHFLAPTPHLDNGGQVSATEGSRRCSLVENGDQRSGPRKEPHKHETSQRSVRRYQRPPHHNQS